jgi:hypothetical protein
MSETSDYQPTDDDIYNLVDRLRSTGNHYNDETQAIESRVPNFHDCHLAANVIESLMIFKHLATNAMSLMIKNIEVDE